MTPKHLLILLLALFTTSVAQSDDELHIPVESDNQFPPDNHSELDLLPEEGSGASALEEPLEFTTVAAESPVPLVEDVQLSSTLVNIETEIAEGAQHYCPATCVCNIEGDTENYVVDCSNGQLTELPKSLDSKTTELNLQNNKLTEIPQVISELKNLKILNINNNEIKDIKAGSISELPQLTSLKLSNNRLIEYPTDLKNSFGLTNLEELDLGGNDMRTALTSETFSIFKALKKLTLPQAATELAEDLCASLKGSLQTVCTESCSTMSFDCMEAPETLDEDLLDVALPGLISADTDPEEYLDPIVNPVSNLNADNVQQDNVEIPPATNAETNVSTAASDETTATPTIEEPSFRSAVIQASDEKPAEVGVQPVEDISKSNVTAKSEGGVVEATTSTTKTGGVDKSLIGIIVAGMVVVVAGITIKKNWSSIKNRFSSSPRNANERTNGATANGTTPEEVPLQEKSPV